MNCKLNTLLVAGILLLVSASAKCEDSAQKENPAELSQASKKIIDIFAMMNKEYDKAKKKIQETRDKFSAEKIKAEYEKQQQKLIAKANELGVKLEEKLKKARENSETLAVEIAKLKKQIADSKPKDGQVASDEYYKAVWKIKLLNAKFELLQKEIDYYAMTVKALKHDKIKELPAKRKLVWSDEFNYKGLPDSDKWIYEEGFVRNKEKQYYTKARLENVRVENGCLILEGRKEKFKNAKYKKDSKDWRFSEEFAQYTSGSIKTKGKASWKYGYVEVRAKIPTGSGSWPAIWMLGTKKRWPACGEIDIMENIGRKPDLIHATIHFRDINEKYARAGNKIKADKPYDDFHIYALEWNAEKMDFYYDGQKYFSYKITDKSGKGDDNIFRQPFYLLLNLALGGSWGGKLDDKILPLKYYIDYVRVYQ